MQNLNLNSLRVFAAAARHLSFLKASEELNLSQGAVSQRIKQLEDRLGVLLFVREARGVSLTKAGAELAQAVETSLGLIETATKNIQRIGAEITLHVSPSIAHKWLAPRLPAFSKRHPQTQLSIEASATVLPRPLHWNEVSLRHGKNFPSIRGQQMRRLTEVNLVAVCSPDFEGIQPDQTLPDMLSLPLIQDTHRRWDKHIINNGTLEVPEPLIFNSASLAIDAAINKQGIAIAPSMFVQHDITEGRLRQIWKDDEPSGEYLFLIWPDQDFTLGSLLALAGWVHEQFGLTVAD